MTVCDTQSNKKHQMNSRYSIQNGIDIECSVYVLHDRFAIQTELIQGN